MSEFIEILSSQSKKDLDEFISKLEQGVDLVNKINKEGIKVVSPSESKKSIEGINKEIQKSNKLKTEAEKLDISLQRANERLNATRSKSGRELQKVRVEQTAVNRAAKEEATLNSSLIGAYQKLNLQRTQASRRLRDLLASEKASNAEIRRAQSEFNKLDARVRKADMAVRDHTKNVGNYRSALGGLGISLRSVASAFGFTSAIFIFANSMRDAVRRVREFDKSMTNLAGILGVSRSDLKGLESDIISVAASSIKTSNEVADLATTLITLGKTEAEVRKLLKPTNDLSIALQATSEDAGQLLVGTLNAFGKSADEADHFANVIAKMRTRSALDFQQIADSMGYIAPAANAAGMSIEQAGAMVGILADNNIKGQRAGRLMSSSLLRLAKDGLTLEDALSKLNKAQAEGASRLELLALSAELFDAQAAPLGLILAANTERLKDFSKELENSDRALDELTEAQLKSLDARLKILDSTWESFILNIENGNNVLSRLASWGIDRLAGAIENGTLLLNIFTNGVKNSEKEVYKFIQNIQNLIPIKNRFLRALDRVIAKRLESIDSMEKSREAISKETQAFVKMHGTLAPFTKSYQDLIDATTDWNSILKTNPAEKQEKTVGNLKKQISDLTASIDDNNASDIQGIRLKQEKIAELEKELNAILGVNKATKESNEVIKGTVSWYKQQISELERKRDALALTGLELQKYNGKIANLKDSLEKLERSGRLVSDMMKRIEADSEMPNFNLPGKIDDGRRKAEQFQKALERLKHQYQDTFGTLPPILGVNFDSFGTLFFGLQFGFESAGEAAQAFGQIAIETFRSVMEMQNMALENQIRNLEAQRNVEIEFAGGSAAARGEIEERFQKRKAELQKKQAENNKKAAIVESIIGTAVAVVKALSTGNLILAKIVGALGAAQTAIIAAQPIPQFAEGVRNFEGGKAIVGDGGKREPITDKSGRLIGISPAKSTLVDLPKGANVYSSEADFYRELNGMLGSNNIIPIPQGDSLTEEEIYNAMKKAIGNLPSNETVIDKNGFTTFIFKGMNKKKILNNRVTFKGKNI